MPEQKEALPKKRGRPPVSTAEINETNSPSYEFNTALPCYSSLWDNFIDCPISLDLVKECLKDPMRHNQQLRSIAWWAYRANGSIASAVDYLKSMHTLDKVIVCRNCKKPSMYDHYRQLFLETLSKIKYKQFIRDAILRNANDGISFYYFETVTPQYDNKLFLSDIDVCNIVEINQASFNAAIISLPVDYCKIAGRKNGSYEILFDLKYFQNMNPDDLSRKLKAYPKEIRDGWNKFITSSTTGSWLRLNNKKTIVTKIKSAINEPWGVPISIAALDDILYAEYFTNTKRNVLADLNSQIFYQTFPEGKEKGMSALTNKQQGEQHNTVKSAILNKRNKSGTSFFSLAAGTKLESLTVDTSIFDEKNENAIKDNVPTDLGISSSSLNGNSKGNYATASMNLELVAGNIYSWITDIVDELNKCINYNIIKDDSCKLECYILPTTYVNRDKQVNYAKELYTLGSGSLSYWIASTGVDVDAYQSLMDYELENGWNKKYLPHQTAFTQATPENGRPSEDSDNHNTIQSKTNNSNDRPKPSSQKGVIK